MADHKDQELNRLRHLVVKLSKEIDYKNHLLMEKEGLSLEKFATMSWLMEEKERLLVQKFATMSWLMAQKYRLHEAYTKGMQDFEQLKLELKKVRRDLETEKRNQCRPTGEMVTNLGKIDEELGPMTTTCQSIGALAVHNDKLHIEKCEVGKLVARAAENDKSLFLDNRKASGKMDVQCKKKQVEKVHNEVLSKMGELEKQTKQLQEGKRNQINAMKTESVDYDVGSSSHEPLGPPYKKLKVSKSQNAEEQTNSILEIGKVPRRRRSQKQYRLVRDLCK